MAKKVKKRKIIKKQKAKAMARKYYRKREEISFSSAEKENYKNNIKDDMILN